MHAARHHPHALGQCTRSRIASLSFVRPCCGGTLAQEQLQKLLAGTTLFLVACQKTASFWAGSGPPTKTMASTCQETACVLGVFSAFKRDG